MGNFSFMTGDTHESIPSEFSDHPDFPCRPVYLLQPDGNHILEEQYGGYGQFGGVDAFAWLARMNLLKEVTEGKDDDEARGFGIDLFYDESGSHQTDLKFPLKFSFNKDAVYAKVEAAKPCDYQGDCYPDDNEEW